MINFPNAKINLGLNIISKRTDGFHDLESCFLPILWKDALEILPSDNEAVNFTSSGISIPGDPTHNLVLKAYQLLKSDFALSGVRIHLHKEIPMGAGLGGGSSDAAFTLKTLNSLFRLSLDNDKLASYASRLGSDCPFFIYNKPMLAQGRGEILSPVEVRLHGYQILVVMPDVTVGTAEAYSWIKPAVPKEKISDILHFPPEEWRGRLVNDFEAPVMERYPVIGELKQALLDDGAIYASMSGSGAAVFGIFRQAPDTKRWKSLKHWCGPF